MKLADLAHNADESRYAGCLPPDAVLEKRRRKYAAARAVLLEGQG